MDTLAVARPQGPGYCHLGPGYQPTREWRVPRVTVSEADGPGSGSGTSSDFIAADNEGAASVTAQPEHAVAVEVTVRW
ncbi:MAG: hypothetical protein OXF89_04405 [Rhodospirillaceae bacterium]|nr:hypothetical protein [Rhodospirillaceae bacterium]